MVTTTTKTLNYSITKGNQTNSVNATITSTPGFNSNYLGKIPGILKLIEVLLCAVAIGLVASLRQEQRPLVGVADDYGRGTTVSGRSYLQEIFLVGEVYFLCAHSAVLTILLILLITYLFHTTSAMIIPKATNLQNVVAIVHILLLLSAGITLVVMTLLWQYDPENPNKPLQAPPSQTYNQVPIRLAAGAIAIVNGLLHIGNFIIARKELAGPKTL